ncbi:MAG: hypothetical protein ACFBSG_05835 [Leptolyngbyaceae cyanobacterium]
MQPQLLDMTSQHLSGIQLMQIETLSPQPAIELTAQMPKPVPIVAQQFEQDVVSDIGNAISTFIESGQIWALLIGFVLGYV